MSVANIFASSILDRSGSDTLFILGSGWSINSMTAKMFSQIGKHQSVGINFWFFHDFVPSLFSFDAGKVADTEKFELQKSLVALGLLFSKPDLILARPKVLYLRPYQLDKAYLVPVPPQLRDQVWVYGRANLLSGTRAALLTDLKLVLRKIATGTLPPAILPDNGSSVVRLIFLGLAQGFRNIVLAGIDLDSRPHFWLSSDDRARYPEYIKLFPEPDSEPHGTTRAVDRPIGTLEFIEILNQAMSEQASGKLWVASPDSELSHVLPQFEWD
jgi:hypothetical protein